MTGLFRLILVLASVLATGTVIFQIRKSKMRIENAVFWVLFSFLLILLSCFPSVIYFFAALLGMQSPANLLYLIIIFLLLYKVFSMSVHISSLEEKLKRLAQNEALRRNAEEAVKPDDRSGKAVNDTDSRTEKTV